jgi:hypothetical protein
MTYDSMNKAARQITGLAQTNLATATAYKPSSKAA